MLFSNKFAAQKRVRVRIRLLHCQKMAKNKFSKSGSDSDSKKIWKQKK